MDFFPIVFHFGLMNQWRKGKSINFIYTQSIYGSGDLGAYFLPN